MKKLVVAATLAAMGIVGSANAADMPVKALVAHTDWTGFYVGGNYGFGVADAHHSATGGVIFGSLDRTATGSSIGAQIGYNWQFQRNWVFGLEADFNWLGINRSKTDLNDALSSFGVKTDWYGTVRGRLGYTSSPSLFYLTGGGAFVDVTNRYTDFDGFAGSHSEVASGWTGGWGIETMLGSNWSAKSEYIYVDAGHQDVFNGNIVGGAPTARFDNRFHVFRSGFNYRFGGPGAPASALPAHNWSGFYAGLNAGVGVSRVEMTGGPPGQADYAGTAFIGGGQIGYNMYLAPQWVVGAEADFGWLGINRKLANWNDSTFTFGVETNWYSTIRGRIGRSTGPALLYFTGGVAFVNVKNLTNGPNGPVAVSEVATGWTVGGGLEAALGNGWTAKTEYLYIDAGTQDVLNPGIFAGVPYHFDNRFYVFRFGVNRKFGG